MIDVETQDEVRHGHTCDPVGKGQHRVFASNEAGSPSRTTVARMTGSLRLEKELPGAPALGAQQGGEVARHVAPGIELDGVRAHARPLGDADWSSNIHIRSLTSMLPKPRESRLGGPSTRSWPVSRFVESGCGSGCLSCLARQVQQSAPQSWNR
jgi:hypothetical protein